MHGVTLALRSGDAQALEAAVAQLQGRMLPALHSVRALPARDRAGRQRAHRRLAAAAAELAAQREAVARAGAAMGRAATVLFPAMGDAYGASGSSLRPPSTGSLIA